MKAIVARDYGPLENLAYADWPEPEAKGRNVVIEAEAIDFNASDNEGAGRLATAMSIAFGQTI